MGRHVLAALALVGSATVPRAGCLQPLPVGPDGTARILLEAEPEAEGKTGAETDVAVCHAELVEHDAARAFVHGDTLVLRKNGYTHASATLRYRLPDDVEPGVYSAWTCFTLGGVATQRFAFRAGPAPRQLRERLVFRQSNGVSWKTEWRSAGQTLRIYPGDRWLEVVVSGMATQQKNLDAFLLALTAPLPEHTTIESGQWRALADSLVAEEPEHRIYVLESGDAREADPFFCYLAQNGADLGAKVSVTTFIGDQAARHATDWGVTQLPAMLVMDDRYALRGMLCGTVDAQQIAAFMLSTTAPGRPPGPFPRRPGHAAERAQPLQDGSPRAWLVVDGWSGPAGLSLWGIDNERRLRPNPDEPCLAVGFDRMVPALWTRRDTTDRGTAVIDPDTADYSWPRGVGYAHIYLHADRALSCVLHTAQTGIGTHAWLDGRPLVFGADPRPPAALSGEQNALSPAVTGVNDQGGQVRVTLGAREPPRMVRLELAEGWHRLLVKLVMQHRKGEVFSFAANLTDLHGQPVTGVQTQLSDPNAAHGLRGEALRLQPLIHTDAPLDLVYPGQPLTLRFDLRRQRPCQGEDTVAPVIPFDANLELVMTDYDGVEVGRREMQTQFPGVATVDFGRAPDTGYYAVHANLYDTSGGDLILSCPADGFSVIRGTAAQFARRDRKKMAVTYYFMADGERYRALYFPWMTRMGIHRNIGSNPGFPLGLATAAEHAGLALTMDFWDIHSTYTQQHRNELAAKAAPYTRWYKSFNEVDIVPRVRKTPEHWVARVKGEYEAAKAARPDALYVGGSLVRPGTDAWFTDCLKLGIEEYHDVWDVHAYPQRPPRLEGTLSNSPNETELGVLTCYERAGKTNSKPFWIGETGARACHGLDGRRWQADTVAKMVACVCSRPDFHYVGFLIPWHYGRGDRNRHLNDIGTGHMPGEAAYYTASALIDGLPYSRLSVGGEQVQAGQFGGTRMLWTTAGPREINLPLDNADRWLQVDVVGRVRELPVESGVARLRLTGSPVYVLSRADYERLTAFVDIREAKVETSNGVPRLTINGRPTTPFALFYNSDIRDWRESGHLQTQVDLARRTGVHIYSMSFRTPRTQPGGIETNWAWCDQYMDAFAELDPEAMFLLRLYAGPNWSWDVWKDITPEHLALYADGSRGSVSIASPYFHGPTDEDLAGIVRHYEASPYGTRILAYEVGGPNIEMFHDRYREKGPDYNPLNQERFRAWLRRRYGTDRALCSAWGDPDVTLATAVIPAFEPGRFPMHGGNDPVRVFYDVPGEQDWVDFSAYSQDIVADRLIDWARIVKRETEGRKLTLFFYGYTFELPGSFSGHYALQRVLDCKDVDLLGSPYSYVDRDVGGAGSFMSPVDSVIAHGKLWFNEDDTRTFGLSRRTNKTGLSFHSTGGQTPGETLGILSRNFASLLAHRAGTWWMDLVSGGAFDEPDLWTMLGERLPFYQALYRDPTPYRPDVAVLVDEESKLVVHDDWDVNSWTLYAMRSSAQQSGAAVGFYTLDDFAAGVVPACKVYVFANAFRLDDAEIAAIHERLTREQATAVWAYAPGYLGPSGPDAGRVSRVVGMDVAVRDGVQGSAGVGALAGLAWASSARVSPRFVVTDPAAETLGRYRADEQVSSARSGRSVFLGDMGVTPAVLRCLFEAAGAHIWTRGDEVVQTDGRFLAVHTGHAGEVAIHLPPRVRTEPVGAFRVRRREGSGITVTAARGDTFWFSLSPVPETNP